MDASDIVEVRVLIGGLYQMGSGMSRASLDAWDAYWRGAESAFFRVAEDRSGSYSRFYLVGTFGGGLIHPMDGLCYYTPRRWFGSCEQECLLGLFRKIVERLGGTCRLDVTPLTEVYKGSCLEELGKRITDIGVKLKKGE